MYLGEIFPMGSGMLFDIFKNLVVYQPPDFCSPVFPLHLLHSLGLSIVCEWPFPFSSADLEKLDQLIWTRSCKYHSTMGSASVLFLVYYFRSQGWAKIWPPLTGLLIWMMLSQQTRGQWNPETLFHVLGYMTFFFKANVKWISVIN